MRTNTLSKLIFTSLTLLSLVSPANSCKVHFTKSLKERGCSISRKGFFIDGRYSADCAVHFQFLKSLYSLGYSETFNAEDAKFLIESQAELFSYDNNNYPHRGFHELNGQLSQIKISFDLEVSKLSGGKRVSIYSYYDQEFFLPAHPIMSGASERFIEKRMETERSLFGPRLIQFPKCN